MSDKEEIKQAKDKIRFLKYQLDKHRAMINLSSQFTNNLLQSLTMAINENSLDDKMAILRSTNNCAKKVAKALTLLSGK